MSRQDDLDAVLREVTMALDDVAGVVYATRDGLPVSSTVGEPRAGKIAAMAAAVLSLSEQTVGASPVQPVGSAVIRGSEGCLAVFPSGVRGALAVQTGPRPNIGLMNVELPQAAASLDSIVGGR